MKVSQLASLIPNLICDSVTDDVDIIGAELDSRAIKQGNIFFGAKGEHLDGNQYASNALENGASCVIIDDSEVFDSITGNKLLVADTIEALVLLGIKRFAMTSAKKIAITGSFGKTGTKECLKNVLSINHKVYATAGNKNNDLGLALTGAGIDDNADILVIELGSNAMGEIETLSKIANPDIAIVVSIGSAHIGRFGGYDNIIKEKLSIANGLKLGGTLIIPEQFKDSVTRQDIDVVTFGNSDKASYYIDEIKRNGLAIEFSVNGEDSNLMINHPYQHLAYNSLSVIATARQVGDDYVSIAKGLDKFQPNDMHGNIKRIGDYIIIDDTYNAGAESMMTAINALGEIDSKQKYAIIGEMLEIDGYEDEIYSKIIQLTDKYADVSFILCGDEYMKYDESGNRKIFRTKTDAMDTVMSITAGVVLIKASRGRKFEDFTNMLVQRVGAN